MYDCVKKGMAQLKTTGQDWWFCTYLISMNYYNESKKFSLKYVKTGNSIEFEGSRNDNLVEGILTKGLYSNWIAFPALRVSCDLSDFSDLFWNREQLEYIIENDFDVETILLVIDELKLLFD